MKRSGGFRIVGTGVCLPERVLSNEDIRLERNPEIKPGWVAETLGIRERRVAEEGVRTSDLAAGAAASALRRAGVTADSVDLLIVATATPDRQAPATACITQSKAGLHNAAAFDVSAVCCGFLYAMTTAAAFLRAGQARRALVVGADVFSRVSDWSRRDCVFFGDGAGAALLERSSLPKSAFEAELFSDGARADAFHIEHGSSFSMDGKAVFEAATEAVPRCIERVLARNGLRADDIDVVVPHQPSVSLLQRIAWLTGVPFQKFRTNMDRYANTAGATIPIVLHETVESDGIKTGDTVLFAAAGAGFTAGAAVYRWH